MPAAAGWHEDPEDSRYMKYWNGRQWGQRVLRQHDPRLANGRVYRPQGVEDAARTRAEDLRRHHAAEATAPVEEPQSAAVAVAVAEEPLLHSADPQPVSRRERRRLEREHLSAASEVHGAEPEFVFVAASQGGAEEASETQPVPEEEGAVLAEEERADGTAAAHDLPETPAAADGPALPGLDWDVWGGEAPAPAPARDDDTGTFDILSLMEDDEEEDAQVPAQNEAAALPEPEPEQLPEPEPEQFGAVLLHCEVRRCSPGTRSR